jgi:polysaccharide export outer membrane protein
MLKLIMKKIIALLLLLFLAASCIPTKRITYLQESNQIVQDSLISIRKVQAPYRLQIGDILSISIKAPFDPGVAGDFSVSGGGGGTANVQQASRGGLYFTGFTVSSHGSIRVPQMGEVPAVGKTIVELRTDLEKILLNRYFNESSALFVDVKLEGLRYTMVGEVGSPGQNTILRDQVSIIEAIADAGGIPITGDLTAVKIVRQYAGGVKTHELDLTTIDVFNSPYYFLQPNDMIVVKPLPQKALGTGTTGLQSFTTVLSVFATLVTTYLIIDNLTTR